MKALIVYYSLTGNVDDTARKIAELSGADLLRLEAQKAYPDKGFGKFFWGGKSAVMGEKPALVPYSFDAAAYGLIVFGTPVWAGTFAPPLRTFIADNADALKGKRFAAFFCSSGGDAAKAEQKLSASLGNCAFEAFVSLVDPKDKPKEGNKEKIAAFAGLIERDESEETE